MTSQQRAPQSLALPERTDLPYFAYGLFKPGELAYGQIESLLDGGPVEARVPGALYVRDGLPLLKLGVRNPAAGPDGAVVPCPGSGGKASGRIRQSCRSSETAWPFGH